MRREQMVKNGSMVAIIGHHQLEGESIYLLAMGDGKVCDQAILQRGPNFMMLFVGMTISELEYWINQDNLGLFGETRKIINSFNEEEDYVEPMDRALPLQRSRQA